MDILLNCRLIDMVWIRVDYESMLYGLCQRICSLLENRDGLSQSSQRAQREFKVGTMVLWYIGIVGVGRVFDGRCKVSEVKKRFTTEAH